MTPKMITDKQISFIQSLKHLLDDNKYGNPIDRLDISKVTRYDASKLIQGMLGLRSQHTNIRRGYGLSISLDEALDNIYNTLEHYLQNMAS